MPIAQARGSPRGSPRFRRPHWYRPRRAKTYAPALGSPARWLPSTDAPPSHTSCSWAEEKEKRGKELLLSSRATLGSLPGIQTLRNEKLHSNGFVGAAILRDVATTAGMRLAGREHERNAAPRARLRGRRPERHFRRSRRPGQAALRCAPA